MNDTQLNSRQLLILKFLVAKPACSRKDLSESLTSETFSRITLIRDLNLLIKCSWIVQTGGGKYVTYSLIPGKELLVPIDSTEYFKTNTDQRYVRYTTFNVHIINNLTRILSAKDLDIFEQGKQKLADRMSTVDSSIIKRELERFTIEFSWKSSQIEGNTYSLLETEELIKNKKEAKGHDKSEAIMIINHKSTFDTILAKSVSFKKITEIDIRTIHAELTKDLDIVSNVREFGVGITGTRYLPFDNKFQIEEALHGLIERINQTDAVPEKSLILLAMISYLQPFADGNKRTARMVSNAVLLANGYYPLSYRSVDEVEFKKALIIFYEQNNIYNLKHIFLDQQQFAVSNYFI
jgi:Fic family protein